MKVKERLLELKIERSIEVLKKAFDRFEKVGVDWSTGKGSTVTLFLARKLKPDILVLFADTNQHFQETYDFRDKLTKEWNLNLINVLPDVKYEKVMGDREKCCYALKMKPMVGKIESLGLDAVITAIRWDEYPGRSSEDYISKREEGFNYPHYRIHPLLHWTEEDLEKYIEINKVPCNKLYDKGLLPTNCRACVTPMLKSFSEKNAIYRDEDREKILRKLRTLGYLG